MSGSGRAAGSYARTFGRVMTALAGLASLGAPLLDAGPRNAVWANAGAILAYAGLERLAARRWPGRSISLLRAILLIAVSQPTFLILAFFVEGDAVYRNRGGNFSHSDQAWMVALAWVVLFAAALVGAVLAGRGRDDPSIAVTNLQQGYSSSFLWLVSWMAGAHSLVRLLLIFAGREVPVAIAYGLRLYLSLFLALFVFLGMALRARMIAAQAVTALTVVASGIVLLTGGRSDALFPLLYLSLGYVLARPMPRAVLARGLAVAVPVFMLAMYAGGALRSDQLGRTGEAAIARAGRLDALLGEAGDVTTFSGSTIRRMVSNSTHSVITRIPAEVPFEDDGLLKLPAEFADRFLPRLNLTGVSESELPRNWMLNDLGFLVTWSTRIELTMVADAWYRGGWAGIIVAGLLLGLFVQLAENGVYRAMRRSPQFSSVLVFALTGLLQALARDIVGAIRTLVFLGLAALVVVAMATVLESQRLGRGRRPVPRHPAYRERPPVAEAK